MFDDDDDDDDENNDNATDNSVTNHLVPLRNIVRV